MNRWLPVLLISTLVSLVASPAATRSSDARAYVEDAYRRGERLDFILAWGSLVGGKARMTVTPSEDGERLTISSVAESTGVISKIFKVKDVIESTVDRTSFSTLRFYKSLNEKNRFKQELTVVDESRGVAMRKGKEIDVPQPVFDPLSTVFYLRKLDLVPGQKHMVTLLADGKVYSLEAEVLKREKIRTEAGVFRTVVVEPKMHGGGLFGGDSNRLLIWYSDDERHIPVRIRSEIPVGNITVTLRSFKVGIASPSRPLQAGAPRR